jgi:hypothetical protein
MPAQKRDNAYYEDRLRLEHPAVHADFLKGVYRTLADAFTAAGMRKPRSRLHELKNAWDKASQPERDEFIRHIGGSPPVATTSSALPMPFLVHRRLTSPAIAAIMKFMDDRKLKTGEVMVLIGRAPLDASVGMALRRNTKIRHDIGKDLETLLTAQGYWTRT